MLTEVSSTLQIAASGQKVVVNVLLNQPIFKAQSEFYSQPSHCPAINLRASPLSKLYSNSSYCTEPYAIVRYTYT